MTEEEHQKHIKFLVGMAEASQKLKDAETPEQRQRSIELRKSAESRLSIKYEEDGSWRINYTLPTGQIIAINNRMPAGLALAQIRGIMANFALTAPR